eukprot:1179282-Prorocentrum_minimum.AAC.6
MSAPPAPSEWLAPPPSKRLAPPNTAVRRESREGPSPPLPPPGLPPSYQPPHPLQLRSPRRGQRPG